MDFKLGDKLKLTNNEEITVKSLLGEGGQGTVYLVSYHGKDYALKWYLPSFLKSLKPNCKQFYKNLKDNVLRGAPSPAFLWQQQIAITGKQSKGFGYLMNVRPQNYVEFTKFIKAKVKFSGTETVIRAAINVVEAFQALHRKGLSYQDLNPGNFFIDRLTGDVLVCDNDNVAPDGDNLGVGGTPGYIAPEVILGKSKPNTNTDLFSLSVILFELFFMSHPLDGANCCKYPCLTQKVEKDLYAENPVFVMDANGGNPPVRGVHSNLIRLWPVYPDYLHQAFRKAFGEGIKEPNKRLSEGDWRKILYRLLDDSVRCPRCGELNFASMVNGKIITCDCGKQSALPPKVILNNFEVVAAANRTVSEYHLSYGNRETAVATFLESKKTAGVFGLRNDTKNGWSVVYPEKEPMVYDPGKTVTLVPGTEIVIGNKKATVE